MFFYVLDKLYNLKMGNEISNGVGSEAPRIGEASPLYWACRNGDVQMARQILSAQQFSDMDQVLSMLPLSLVMLK